MDEITAVFRVTGPNLERDSITVPQTGIRVGRSGDNDLVLPSSEISRHHMRLEWINGEIHARDLNSSNGIWFNDERVRPDATQVLRPGESIRLGPFLMTLERVDTPKKGRAAAAHTQLDQPAPPPPAPEPVPTPATTPPMPEPAPVPAEPPYAAVTAPPEPPAPGEKPPALPPVEKPPRTGEAPRVEFSVPAPPPVEAPPPAEKEKSFLFAPVEPEAEKPAPPPARERKAAKPEPPPAPAQPPPPPRPPAPPASGPPRIGGDGASLSPEQPLPPLPPLPLGDGRSYPVGIPRDYSSWLKYLPAIYQDEPFVGRFLLIFEAMMSPSIWTIDNIELYFTPDIAPLEWVRWIAGWFDIVIPPELPASRQRLILSQVGWLASRRGTRAGMERLLELYCGVRPEIVEEPAHFIVRLPLSESSVQLPRETLDQLILAHKPAFATYALEIS
jgi:phage tail-like protein